eukprot:scaffold4498_cov60-Phaeocystis_antarctica.AAC.2
MSIAHSMRSLCCVSAGALLASAHVRDLQDAGLLARCSGGGLLEQRGSEELQAFRCARNRQPASAAGWALLGSRGRRQLTYERRHSSCDPADVLVGLHHLLDARRRKAWPVALGRHGWCLRAAATSGAPRAAQRPPTLRSPRALASIAERLPVRDNTVSSGRTEKCVLHARPTRSALAPSLTPGAPRLQFPPITAEQQLQRERR